MKKSILIATALLGLPVALQAQNPATGGGADPFVPTAAGAAPPEAQPEVVITAGETTPNISLRYETFSLPLADAAALQRKNPADAAFYQALVDMVARKQAVQESFTMIRARSGEKAVAESISETIYPTGWEPPEMPNSVSVSVSGEAAKPGAEAGTTGGAVDKALAGSSDGVRTPAQPKDFETRNEGITFEVEPTLSEDRSIVDLRCAPDRVTQVGVSSWGQGLARTETPQFESQRVTTAVTAVVGRPVLLGTVNRPPLSKVDADSANRIWFAFVTADLVRP